MADEDEDLTHLSGLNRGDIDLSDETQDFRFLSNLSFSGTDLPKIPKRGEKDFEPHPTNLQSNTLAASRQAMHSALSIPRIHAPKNHIVAMYHPESNMSIVEKVKSQHFQTMGKNVRGKEWLLPEETLFMLERGTLDVRWPINEEERKEGEVGVPMSLQGAYATFIGMEESVGGKLTLEMYTVYAGLKRAGYTVFRTGSWDDERPGLNTTAQASSDTQATRNRYWGLGLFAEIWKRLLQKETSSYLSLQQLAVGPLVRPGLYRNYVDIYRLLHLIPSSLLTEPPTFLLPPSTPNPFRLTFDVYKPTGKFRKSNRGPPDFRVCVINARETQVPTLAQMNDLIATVPADAPPKEAQMYQKLKHGRRNIILAVVDQGIPSYIRMADAPFEGERLYERMGRGPKGKRGGRGR